jgi:hypothetical protein
MVSWSFLQKSRKISGTNKKLFPKEIFKKRKNLGVGQKDEINYA